MQLMTSLAILLIRAVFEALKTNPRRLAKEQIKARRIQEADNYPQHHLRYLSPESLSRIGGRSQSLPLGLLLLRRS